MSTGGGVGRESQDHTCRRYTWSAREGVGVMHGKHSFQH